MQIINCEMLFHLYIIQKKLNLLKNYSLRKNIYSKMNDYRNNAPSSTSKTKASGFKSPSHHETLDLKAYKKKYEKKVQQLIKQRQRTQQLQQLIEQMTKKLQKQDKQLAKKQQIQDVLLQQINQLRTQIQESRSMKTSSKQTSLQEKRSLGKKSYDYLSMSNVSSQFTNSRGNESKINGYNFTLSDLNNKETNSCKDDSGNSHQNSSLSLKSFETQNYSDQSDSKVGGYFGSLFNK